MSIQQVAEDYARACSSGDAEAVASYYRQDGKITINRGEPHDGREALLEMIRGFHAEFPGMTVKLEHLRVAGNHVMFG